MPQRKTQLRVKTEEVQGQDSYVIYRPLKVGEARRMQKEAAKDTEDSVEAGLKEVCDHILGWNWVGDKGEPLKLPSEDPDVLDDLTVAEMAFLSDLLLGDVNAKN